MACTSGFAGQMFPAASTWLCHSNKDTITDNKYVNKQVWLCSNRALSIDNEIWIHVIFTSRKVFFFWGTESRPNLCPRLKVWHQVAWHMSPEEGEIWTYARKNCVLYQLLHYSAHNYQSYIRTVTFLIKSDTGTPWRYCRVSPRPQ